MKTILLIATFCLIGCDLVPRASAQTPSPSPVETPDMCVCAPPAIKATSGWAPMSSFMGMCTAATPVAPLASGYTLQAWMVLRRPDAATGHREVGRAQLLPYMVHEVAPDGTAAWVPHADMAMTAARMGGSGGPEPCDLTPPGGGCCQDANHDQNCDGCEDSSRDGFCDDCYDTNGDPNDGCQDPCYDGTIPCTYCADEDGDSFCDDRRLGGCGDANNDGRCDPRDPPEPSNGLWPDTEWMCYWEIQSIQ